jgi:hypothetical protein
LRGIHFGKKISSGGIEGSSSHDHSPNSASQMRVKTRLASSPPLSRTNARALAMCSASGSSPASRSAA